MNIDEAIRNRRSIRKFKDKSLTKDQIIAILDAGNRAPTAKNRVQWRFHIFQGDAKTRLVQTCRDAIEKLPKISLMASTSQTFKIMDQAPVVIIALFFLIRTTFIRSSRSVSVRPAKSGLCLISCL